MIGQAEANITYAGFVALTTLFLVIGGFVLALVRRSQELRDRVTTLESELEHHVENGVRHQRPAAKGTRK